MAIKKGFGSSSIASIANGNKLDDFSLKSNDNTNNNTNNLPTDRGWLPAPYNIITEPVNAGGNTTNYGNNYAASKEAFDERVARIDQTEEAANLRQAWATPPRVSIENGRIKLTGSTQFLASDTAQQLHNIFKEMEGQTYNTESLNQQIEAWNVDLQKMAEDNMKNLDTLNEMNYSISQTATGPNPHMLTYADLLRIGNNVAVGRQEDALNSDKLIFVDYEWDDEGNQIPKYMTAKEFAEEFNSTPNPGKPAYTLGEVWDNAWSNLPEKWENRNADALISGKRRAWSQLNTQAKEGDPGAIAKLMYLQGGSEGGPANVVMSGTERFNDFVFTASINAMNGLTSGLDFATKWYDAAFGNIFGLPRLVGNISNVISNGWDWNKFWESDIVDKQVEEMNDVVSWANSYFSAVTPGSTMLGATLGGIEGAVASIAYSVVSANIGQELEAKAVNKGLTIAGKVLEKTGQGVKISATIEGAAGKLQGVTSMNGSMVTRTGLTIANATRGTAELSVVLPKFLVEKFPGIARAITERAFYIQAASQGAQLAGMAGSDIGVFVTKTTPTFESLFGNGAHSQSLVLATQGTKTVGHGVMLGKKSLDSMRNWSTGIRLGLNLYMVGNYNAIRHIDRYLRDQYNGKDDGDMASYVAINTARDVAIAAALGIGGATINHFRQISRMSKIAPTRVVDAVQIGADNSANGFYTSNTSSQTTAQAKAKTTKNTTSQAEAKTTKNTTSQTKAEPAQETYTELTKMFNSSMTANGERFFVPNDATQATVVPGSSSVVGPQGVATATGIIKDNKLIRSRIVPAVGGFNVVSSARDLATGEETTDITFHLDFDSANEELQKSTVPIVNPKTLGNSDLAVSANVAPLSVGGLSAIRHLPDGTSRLRISNGVLYLKPEEFEQKVSDIVAQMSPETAAEFTHSVRSIDLDELGARIYGEGPELPAPQLRVPKNAEEAKAFARDVATARAVAQFNGNRGVVIPTRVDADTVDIVRCRTPRKYVVTENGLTKGSFSDIQEALDYKAQGDRQIYELDPNTPVMDRPPVTTDSLYNPAVRSESAVGKMPEDTTYEAPKFDASGNIERFNGLMASMPLLRESPTDYTQGIVDIAREVQSVYNGIAETVDMPALYEDYARQIAEGVEQPTVSPELRKALAPLSNMLSALGHYFDPSGSSLTQDFYLPTGAPSKKLASVEDALLHPDRAVDVDNPATVTFDEILVDPMRIGDSGFWEKRSGELFRDEDGNFTMAKAGTLEENLIAYTVAALTRGQNALLVAANNEVAFAKFDRNRNQISTTEALKGLKGADKNRQKIRAAQIKNVRGYDKKLKNEKITKLEDNYDDKSVIDAIEEAYAAKDFAKDINYTRNVAENSRTLGYRRTLTINNIKGSALRFGTNNGFRGIANDIRKASYIKVTGTKWVTRYGEKRCVAFGLTDAQMAETEATVSEPAVNLGDSAMMLFASDRAAGTFYRTILDQSEQWATQGGFELLNSIKDFARENFLLLSNPERAAEKLFQKLTSNFDAYSDPTALYLANQETISAWIKSNAAQNINSAIQMADVDAIDDRTIDAIDQIMTKALVGSSAYNSKIVSALQRATYASTLWFNPSPMIGNLLSEPARGIDLFGYKVFAKAMKQFISPKARAIAKTELGELDTYLNNDPELVGLAEQVKSKLSRAFDSFENKAMSPLQISEEQKNLLFWMMAKENAKLMYPKDPSAQLQNALRTFNDVAISGGAGTTPGVASSNLGRMAFVLKTFSLRNWDDFIEMTKQIGYGRSGSYRWDHTNRGQDTGGQGGYSSTAGGKKFDYKKAGRFVGGTLLRRYLLWLLVLGPLGRSIWDALGGDPTGLTENHSRGLYDDEGTDEYEGMTPLDNIINHIPTGFIFGTLKDFYFAARRAGVETGDFLGPIDIERDARLQKDLKQHIPLGVMTRRVGDMLELMDRGYSFNSNDNKTYAAPQTLHDTILGFALGKSATSNAQAYNKYRYGTVNIWGDTFEGDWLDFAMSANPLAGDLNMVKFDTTRTNYNGVFHGSYNDVPVMQVAVADLRERRATIIRGYNEDLEKFTGEFEGLTDEQKKAKAAERREAKIQAFTEDVQRLVDEYQKAGNALSDKQINTLMYLFDFNEGDDDTYDSQIARERYVQAELPDVSTNIVPKQDKDTGEVTEPNYFQRSLVYQNAVQGRYGIPREAAKAVDSALANFKNVHKEYKNRVNDLNDKAYSAAKGSADRKKYQAEIEKVQEEYLNQLYTALTPVVQQYGTEVLSSNDVIESLQPYMSSMVPYSSIKKYGLQYNNGNDIVWGQLSDWVKNRWGATAPTAGSDPEITNGIKEIKSLKNQGKISQAKSQARLLLERIARGSLSARNNDVIELRSLLYD